jgi:hypothetical protein
MGTNYLAVEVHQASIPSSDVVWGMALDAVITTTSPAQAGVVINEVLAHNATYEEPDGSRPDWVELYNPSSNAVDLAQMSLTDSTLLPQRWVFPPGSIIPARGYLAIRFEGDAPASSTNTGFGLKAEDGSVYLFNQPGDGGGLLSWITYGLQAADWSLGRVPDGSGDWSLTLPSLGNANLAATLAASDNLRINEWMADPASGEDWFEIHNPNPQPVDISGLHLTDKLDQPAQYRIRPLSFLGAGVDGYQTFSADNNSDAGGDHVNFALRAAGETIGLATADATAFIDTVSFDQQQFGISEGRFPDGERVPFTRFPQSPTPGRSNFLPLPDIVVNEVLSHSDLPLEDAVELYNQSGDDVDISGWWLSDSDANLRKHLLPADSIVPAQGYLVLYEYQFNGPDTDVRFAFSSARGDEVFLSQTDAGGNLTGYRAMASFGPAANGVSFGRFHTSQGVHFVALADRTFGVDRPGTVEEFRTGTGGLNAGALVGPVVISEIMYHPPGTNEAMEFLELRNISPTNVFLFDPLHPANTWRLRKGIDFDFPTGFSMAPSSHLIVVPFDPDTDTAALAAFRSLHGTNYTLIGPYAGNLSNSGELVDLLRPDPPQTLPGPDFGLVPYVLLDRVDYRDEPPWPLTADGFGDSLQKPIPALYGNDPLHWIAALPSPGPGGAGETDTDGDGMPDAWELANGLDPSRNDAAEDADGDGLTNLEEYMAGTDPGDPNSLLQVHLDSVSGGTVTLRFQAVAGKTYTLQYQESLSGGPWQKLADVPALPVAEEVVHTDPGVGGVRQRFYRLVTPQVP